jgi:hypothetical protein
MKNFLRSHPDIILASTAFVLLAVLIGLFSWAINDVVFEVHRAMVFQAVGDDQGFDLKDAKNLDLRGLLNGTSTIPIIVVAPTPVISTSTTFPAGEINK